MASMTTLSFKLGKTKEGVSGRQHDATSKRFSRSSRHVAGMLKQSGGGKGGGEVLACGVEDRGRSDDVLDKVGELAMGVVVENEGLELGFSEC